MTGVELIVFVIILFLILYCLNIPKLNKDRIVIADDGAAVLETSNCPVGYINAYRLIKDSDSIQRVCIKAELPTTLRLMSNEQIESYKKFKQDNYQDEDRNLVQMFVNWLVYDNIFKLS